MFSASALAITGWVLLAALPASTPPKPLPECAMGSRSIELDADTPGEVPEVCIRPAESTTVVFGSRLAQVEVEERERFRVVDKGENTVTLIPSEEWRDGERVRLTVVFQDGQAPMRAILGLVVHPRRSERLVEVSRRSRSLASYQQGERQARAEAVQCQEDKARLQREGNGRSGLTGLLANKMMGRGKGVLVWDIEDSSRQSRGSIIRDRIYSYRSTLVDDKGIPRTRVRLAVELWLQNTGETPWMPQGAVLVGRGREELGAPTVWLSEPMGPGQPGQVVVEVEAEEQDARGAFTLKLWDESGRVGATFEGVTFP